MHELGIALRIVDLASRIAKGKGMSLVTEVHMEIGGLTGIVPEALSLSFEFASKGTPVSGAHLQQTMIPPLALCKHCLREFHPDGFMTECPGCGSFECKIIRGRELNILTITCSGGDRIANSADENNVN